jgi:hypothetical protein
MNFKDLHQLINDGVHPVVTGQKKVEDLENYLEPGMRARLIGSTLKHDDVVTLKLDFTEFDEYNKQFESSNYYDRAGQPVLNAREAGHYTPKMDCYVMATDDMDDYMTFTESATLALMKEYTASEVKGTYVEWLEAQVHGMSSELAHLREAL